MSRIRVPKNQVTKGVRRLQYSALQEPFDFAQGWLKLVAVVLIALCAAACATTGGTPRPRPFPGAPLPPSAVPPAPVGPPVVVPASPVAPTAIVSTAMMLRGIPYRNGGNDPNGFDCSGFTKYVFSQFGISLPRDVRSQYRIGTPVDPSELSPGDLVFFATTNPDVSHVAIAIGGNGFVHAPSTWGTVRVEYLSGTYWARRYVGARRVN